MRPYPLTFEWTDAEVMRPLNRRIAAQQYTVGECYQLETREDRSSESHRHYFAVVNAAFENLPEEMAERFPTAEHLRRYALIRAGYRDERSIVAANPTEARKIAAFIKPIDDFAVVSVKAAMIIVWTAKSQSMRAMRKAEFQRSKDAVLGVLSEMLGVSPETLQHNAGQAA